MTITVMGNSGNDMQLHTIESSERDAYDNDEIIGTLYDTEEGITVIYNDGSNEYSIAR